MNRFDPASGDFDEQQADEQRAAQRPLRRSCAHEQSEWPPAWEPAEEWPGCAQPDRQGPADRPSGQRGTERQLTDGERLAEALLRAAQRPGPLDPDAAERALDAFRSARLTGATLTRRRDDWRPGTRLRPLGAWRVALAALAASLTLGGVAYAAFVTLPHHHDHREPTPHTSPAPSSGVGGHNPSRSAHPSTSPSAPGAPGPGPGAARSDAARCRTYLDAAARNPQGGEETDAYDDLVRAAGGKDNVSAYCADALRGRDGADDADAKDSSDGPGHGQGTSEPSEQSGPASSGTSGESDHGTSSDAGESHGEESTHHGEDEGGSSGSEGSEGSEGHSGSGGSGDGSGREGSDDDSDESGDEGSEDDGAPESPADDYRPAEWEGDHDEGSSGTEDTGRSGDTTNEDGSQQVRGAGEPADPTDDGGAGVTTDDS